jgi:hypothetical protein
MKITKTRKNISWTTELVDFIKINYPNIGSTECSVKLNIPVSKIQDIVKFYKIKIPKEIKIRLINERINKTKKYKINTEMFLTPDTPSACYILGLLWADGSLKGSGDNSVRLTLKKTDGVHIVPIIKTTGNWSIKELKYKIHKNPVLFFRCCDKKLYSFLTEMGYYDKSQNSAENIICHIPEELRHYWWRGYFDGDGTLNKNNYGISITSTINQDWSFLKFLPTSIKLKTKKYQQIVNGKTQSCSRMLIWGKENVLVFLNYIYSGEVFGIERKYKHYLRKLEHGYRS